MVALEEIIRPTWTNRSNSPRFSYQRKQFNSNPTLLSRILLLEEMLEKWRRGKRGPLPHLTPLQLLHALLLIDREGPLGRRALSQALQINDGIARGLLERLGEQGIVKVNENGVSLSAQGKTRLRTLLNQMSVKKIEPFEGSDLVPGKSATGIHLAGKYRQGMSGIPERDEAVKSGAQGLITIGLHERKLVIPPDNRDIGELSPKEDARLRGLFDLAENDLILIGFAQDSRRALAGALAATLSIASFSKS